jgi:hypothetical protein
MVPCVRVLYPDGVIQFQQDLSSVNDSRVVQELLAQQAIFELTGWPPQATYMNPIENMLSEVKKIVQETWPEIRARNKDALWNLVSDSWDQVASSQRYVLCLIESIPRRMRSVVEAEGFWTLNKVCSPENSPFKG